MEDEAIWRGLMTLNVDVLARIFKSCDIFESTSAIYDFWDAWLRAGCDPQFWHTLDFSMLKSDYIKTQGEPDVYVRTHSEGSLSFLLRRALNLSQGNILTLIFHYNLFLSNDQFMYTAERCPRLRRLVFVSWNRIESIGESIGICTAIRGWKDLESMTMPSIKDPQYVFEEISRHCKNFKELKVMGPFHTLFASRLVAFLPKLRVLSLRCSMLNKEVLILILDSLEHLEVLNISHCILVEALPPPQHRRIINEIDQSILQKASRLREFITCMEDSCIMCQRTRKDQGLPRWYSYEQGIWKEDEVSSLAL